MGLLEEMFDDERKSLNERPYSRSRAALDSAKGKVKGAFGSGQVEQGAQQTGELANRLWADFKRYVGTKYGTHPKAVSFEDVSKFFKGNNLDVSALGSNVRRSFSPQDVGQAILAAARVQNDAYADNEPEQQAPAPKQQPAQGQSTPPAQEQPASEPEPAPKSAPSDTSGLQSQIAALSPAERAKLIKLIS